MPTSAVIKGLNQGIAVISHDVSAFANGKITAHSSEQSIVYWASQMQAIIGKTSPPNIVHLPPHWPNEAKELDALVKDLAYDVKQFNTSHIGVSALSTDISDFVVEVTGILG